MEYGILFIWFVMALLGLMIGQRKGRGFAGFVWGALLGPFGWMLIHLGPDARPKCPHCDEIVEHGASNCPHCKQRITWIRGRAVRPSRAVA